MTAAYSPMVYKNMHIYMNVCLYTCIGGEGKEERTPTWPNLGKGIQEFLGSSWTFPVSLDYFKIKSTLNKKYTMTSPDVQICEWWARVRQSRTRRGVHNEQGEVSLPSHLPQHYLEHSPEGTPFTIFWDETFVTTGCWNIGTLCVFKVRKLKPLWATVQLFLNIFFLWVFHCGGWKPQFLCWHCWDRKIQLWFYWGVRGLRNQETNRES